MSESETKPEEKLTSNEAKPSFEKEAPRVLMSQAKNKFNFCSRIQNKMKYSAKYVICLGVLVFLSYYLIGYISSSGNSAPAPIISEDRSKNYNVKVLPDSVNDEGLNALAKESFSYLAMIDAGSSGCRAHVYRYGKLGKLEGPLYILPQHVSKKVKPGLSSFAQNPTAAGESLAGLIDFIKQEVPEKDWSNTPIWLKATAGLRMLETKQSDEILKSVRDYLGDSKKSPFIFRPLWARIISGNEEGGFGWIAYNYLKRIIGPKKTQNTNNNGNNNNIAPYAVIEMGGASSQVTQLAPTPEDAAKIPSDYQYTFTIEKDTYHLYTHSYLGYGAEQAREQLNKLLIVGNGNGNGNNNDPLVTGDASNNKNTATTTTSGNSNEIKDLCLNTGYHRPATVPRKEVYEGPQGVYYNITGIGSTEVGGCARVMNSIFNKQLVLCSTNQPSPYSFNCVYQPDFLATSSNILIFENFYYASSAIGVKSAVNANSNAFPLETTIANIEEATNKICSVDWNTLQTTYPVDSQPKDVNLKMCFVASYATSFLSTGLNIAKDKKLTIQKEVEGSEIEWALGAAYKEAAEFLKRKHLRANE